MEQFESGPLSIFYTKLLELRSRYYPKESIVAIDVMAATTIASINSVRFTDYATNAKEMPYCPYVDDLLYIEYCGIYCNYLDIKGYILALNYNYSSAAAHILQAIRLMVYSKMYSLEDVVIGRERAKLAGLLFTSASGDAAIMQQCIEQATTAYKILSVTVTEDDPDLMEVNHILVNCTGRKIR